MGWPVLDEPRWNFLLGRWKLLRTPRLGKCIKRLVESALSVEFRNHRKRGEAFAKMGVPPRTGVQFRSVLGCAVCIPVFPRLTVELLP